MKSVTEIELFKAMARFGGGFVSQLGLAGLQADKVNTARLLKAFPDYVLTYTTFAEMVKKQNEEKEKAYPFPE